jgi:MOSC domain-containing protein YiiM
LKRCGATIRSSLRAGEARRNIVTRNVPLNHLVGKEFAIGDVRIRGIRLCEPCDHLQKVTGKPVIKGCCIAEDCGRRF